MIFNLINKMEEEMISESAFNKMLEEKMKDFNFAASLMIKYAATNLNPMQRIIVDSTTMEIVSGDKGLYTDKYLVD